MIWEPNTIASKTGTFPHRPTHLGSQVSTVPECSPPEGVCASEKRGESDIIGNGEVMQEMDQDVAHLDRCLQVNMAPGSSAIGAPLCCPMYACFFRAMYARLLLVGLA
jgi:hypothetical protein